MDLATRDFERSDVRRRDLEVVLDGSVIDELGQRLERTRGQRLSGQLELEDVVLVAFEDRQLRVDSDLHVSLHI